MVSVSWTEQKPWMVNLEIYAVGQQVPRTIPWVLGMCPLRGQELGPSAAPRASLAHQQPGSL